MNEYLAELAKEPAAPAIAITALGAFGKRYLDRVLGWQTEHLKADLVRGTERFKASLAKEVAITQAKLEALQEVSKTAYTSRRACRNLIEGLFPQSEADLVRLGKLAEGDAEKLFRLADERNKNLADATLALEEQVHSKKEYLTNTITSELEELLTILFSVRSKVDEFFLPTTKSSAFQDDFIALLEDSERAGTNVADALVPARRDLLNPTTG